MIRALIFDFDGLILETEGPVFQSWKELYQAHGCELSLDDWAAIIGTNELLFDPIRGLEKQLGRTLDFATIAPARRQREADLIAAQPVMPGVRETLAAAKRLGLKVGLASSSDCAWITGHLERLGLLGYFDCIKASDDVRITKPDPELYLAALSCLGVSAAEAVVFEDSPNGILAAKRAGIYCVAVPNELTRGLPLDLADYRLDSLAGMPLEELLRVVENSPREGGSREEKL